MPFTHLDKQGHPLMVDVSEKKKNLREALAEGWITFPEHLWKVLENREIQKGDVLSIAETAGIMGAKKTPELIPLCHTIMLSGVRVLCEMHPECRRVRIVASVKAQETTGVEMEALTAVSVAALTVYDMCKGIDKGMSIGPIRLLRKSGGKSGTYEYHENPDVPDFENS
jgi:cyclic pyranopterin phosphate synthase